MSFLSACKQDVAHNEGAQHSPVGPGHPVLYDRLTAMYRRWKALLAPGTSSKCPTCSDRTQCPPRQSLLQKLITPNSSHSLRRDLECQASYVRCELGHQCPFSTVPPGVQGLQMAFIARKMTVLVEEDISSQLSLNTRSSLWINYQWLWASRLCLSRHLSRGGTSIIFCRQACQHPQGTNLCHSQNPP